MRAASNQQGQRYHRCAARIQQGGQCDQVTLKAEVIEQQVADRFQQLILLPNWRFQLHQAVILDKDKRIQRQTLQQSLTRARELYLEGDIGRVEYEQKRAVYREGLADLTDTPLIAIIATGYLLKNFQTIWKKSDWTLKQKLLRAMLAAVTVRGDALCGWHPNSAFYPLLKHGCHENSWHPCQSGSDGYPLLSKHNIEIIPPPVDTLSL